MTSLLTVTSKGQVTFRKELLDHLHVAAGDKLAVDVLSDGRLAIRAAKATNNIADFVGCLAPAPRRLSIEEIGEAVAAGWAGRK
jgi:bifunctional DNA-binding transcriptional regulator/antitoxin component of YhaV-PrlF toxin-antitoxin module